MRFQHSKTRFQHFKMQFQHSKMRFQHSKMQFQHSQIQFQHSQTQNIGCYKTREAANSKGATPDISRNASSYQELKKNDNKKGKNENNKKIIRSLQNTTKKTRTNARRKLKEEKDLNDKLTNKSQECRAQRLSKKMTQKSEKKCREEV